MSTDIFAPIEDDGWNTDDLCPWCKERLDDVWEYANKESFKCDHCGKPVECEAWTQFILKRAKPPKARIDLERLRVVEKFCGVRT